LYLKMNGRDILEEGSIHRVWVGKFTI
jgi:hypothetical protein